MMHLYSYNANTNVIEVITKDIDIFDDVEVIGTIRVNHHMANSLFPWISLLRPNPIAVSTLIVNTFFENQNKNDKYFEQYNAFFVRTL
jgi:hypothetical protein